MRLDYEEDEWVAEVSSVIYVEFRGDRSLGSDLMALFLRRFRLAASSRSPTLERIHRGIKKEEPKST